MMSRDNPQRNILPSEPPWQFYLFGGLKVFYAGEWLDAPPPRVYKLLSLVLLKPQRSDRLSQAGILFPNLPEIQARRRLSDHLWLLRREIPGLPLDVTGESIRLIPRSHWLDVEAFRSVESLDDSEAWEEALSLYVDELLPGQYAEWLMLERESLHLLWVRLTHKLVAALIEKRDFQRALPHLEKLVQFEPLDEGALRGLMKVYAALSQRGAALAAYERYIQYAAVELQIEPDPVTKAFAESLYNPRFERQLKAIEGEGCEDTPESVLQRARVALIQANRQYLESCLPWLIENCGPALAFEVRLLEIDCSLLFAKLSEAKESIRKLDHSVVDVQLRLAKIALESGDLEEARSEISRVLLASHESGNLALELEGLIVLTKIQRKQGQMVPASISAEKALGLGWQLEASDQIVRTYIEQGWIRIRQGRYREALSVLDQARQIAAENGFVGLQAEVLNGLSLTQTYRGNFLASQDTARSALQIWRDLRILPQEAKTLQNLAMISNQLGNNEESLLALQHAQQIYKELDDRLGGARNQYNLAAAIPYHDEAKIEQAVALAREALVTFREFDQPGWEASTLAVLGYNLWIAACNEEALTRLEEAYVLHDKLGEVAVLPELLAYQGLVLLDMGRLEEARERTQQALLALSHSPLENDIVSEIYYAQAAVLEAGDDLARACGYYDRAYQNLLKYAEQLDEEPARRAFFQRDPTVRRLMDKVYEHGIAPRPDQGVVQPWVRTKAGSYIKAAWTLDAGPPDVALKQSQGAVGLRRTRLERILRESKIQALSPTIQQLAENLGVSTRTIKRDLAVLRKSDKAR
jgi:DNA-binding SARP family transcriptional activator